MDLMLCHQMADFDTLGAAVGLTRLIPGGRVVLTGGAHPGVKRFLALYRDELTLIERRSVNPQRIRSLTVVDTQGRDRLGGAKAWLDLPQLDHITVYDHHLEAVGDIPATIRHVEAVGASTTLVVEQLRSHHCQPTVVEATVMALGIHVDTASLTSEQTTPRDVRAWAWLLEQGASLPTLREYLDPGLTPTLQKLLATALEQLETITVQGYQIASIYLETPNFIPGLSSLAERLMDLTESHGLLLGHRYHRGQAQRLTVIGRSRIPHTNLHRLFAPWGGGGHSQAAAAAIHDPTLETFPELLAQLIAQIPPPFTARDLMSSPVRTIRPETTITTAQRILLRYGHSGLSVVDEQDQLVGIISRRDLDLALHHGFGHAPVKAYMSRNLHTIGPDDHLPRIESLMVEQDVGRLPVVEGGKLLGIVTRTDVLRQRFQGEEGDGGAMVFDRALPIADRSPTHQTLARCPLSDPQQLLGPALGNFLQQLTQSATERGWHLYIVGGVVRDLLLHQGREEPLPLVQDLDLVVDGFHRAAEAGAGVELAKAIQQWYPQARLSVHGAFQTAALLWHQDPRLGSLAVDIATARTEFYPYPAANPEVEASSIRQDLYRRDFTINAMALRLTSPREGEILDFFGGMGDLRSRLIRVLHVNSFIEDPTRIYRAVRFAVRLGFKLEAQTVDLIRYAIESGVYNRSLAHDPKAPALTTRLRAELQYILTTPHWLGALQLLQDLGALGCLHPQLALTRTVARQLRLLDRGLRQWEYSPQFPPWLLKLELLLSQLPTPEALRAADQLQLPLASCQRLAQWQGVKSQITVALGDPLSPSQIVQILQPIDRTLLVGLLTQVPRSVRQRIWQYLTQWSVERSPLNGGDLQQLGYPRGPLYRQILDQLLGATLDGMVKTRSQAIDYVQRHYPQTDPHH
ncbi:CBS domain-containing protein [Spirulina sp. CCNP1310]|uniref:CBS domain-containing protein n=1 Tax=Spirulina sp. CCNP1310 TaxID=3110249 RepID=UPI002B21B6A1|nr:CBS domain-containing protein [Spirulina sp. CCNP1310]MEA5419501.1 CBS domain-containing protein [Spirulina sp. CCNP1310]